MSPGTVPSTGQASDSICGMDKQSPSPSLISFCLSPIVVSLTFQNHKASDGWSHLCPLLGAWEGGRTLTLRLPRSWGAGPALPHSLSLNCPPLSRGPFLGAAVALSLSINMPTSLSSLQHPGRVAQSTSRLPLMCRALGAQPGPGQELNRSPTELRLKVAHLVLRAILMASCRFTCLSANVS